jgi:hypothetical protein
VDARTLIKRLDGPEEVARLCDCTSQAVYRWRRLNRIPKARLKFLRLAKPEVFEELQASKPGGDAT